MFTNILVPLDGSRCSAQALDLAMKVARAEGATLVLLHAIDPTAAAISEIDPTGTAIAPWLNLKNEAGISVTSELLEGEPVEEILDAAERHKSDLIVIGCHGRKGLSRLVLGSVSEAVMRAAHVPTMIAHATSKSRVHARA